MGTQEPQLGGPVAIAATRAEMRQEAAATPVEPVDRVDDVDAGGVPARWYQPSGATGALLYLHGGGFVFGDLVTHDAIARRLANRTGWAVLLPQYRLAPENPYPAAVQDADAAADWLAQRSPERLGVVGDSAGGSLALGQAQRTPDRYAAQVLVYPFVDTTMESYDPTEANEDLTMAEGRWYWDQYLQEADGRVGDPWWGSSAPLPPTLIQLARHDVLHSTGARLGERLRRAGVPVEVNLFDGVRHGFWRRTDNSESEPALAAVAAFLTAR